jgi:glycosyltransferase involved in cell wall biosynthesis
MIDKRIKVAFLSTFPPRECGIAIFTQDLVCEIKNSNKVFPTVIAVSDAPYQYEQDVLFDLQQHNRESYSLAAAKLNDSGIDLLMVEHEYGIFGGEWGEYLLDLINWIKLPVAITLHTALPSPTEKQRHILQTLCQKSVVIIVMAENVKRLLIDYYGISPLKIKMIHHGVTKMDVPSREMLKEQMGLKNRTIVSTFGLISPGKGLEYGIGAIEQVAKKHSDILYLILGQTHPVVKKRFGETYRSSLEKMVRELGLEQNIRFVNKYMTKEEIVRYLKLSDIYMTPYLNKDQAVSGTLAYAMGYGGVIISTPYIYACEMLSEGRGLLAEFENANALACHICYLIEHPKKRMWDHVARQYVDVITALYNESIKSSNTVVLP